MNKVGFAALCIAVVVSLPDLICVFAERHVALLLFGNVVVVVVLVTVVVVATVNDAAVVTLWPYHVMFSYVFSFVVPRAAAVAVAVAAAAAAASARWAAPAAYAATS